MSYMVMTSFVNKYVMFRVPRAGSRSLVTILDEHFDTDLGDDVPWSRGDFDARLISYNVEYDYAWDDYFKLAFVRNPWDRLVSCYNGKIVNMLDSDRSLRTFDLKVSGARDRLDMSASNEEVRKVYEDYRSFEYFIKSLQTEDLSMCDVHYRKQVCMFPVDKMDFIGRFEHFDADVGKVMQTLGATSYNIPSIGKSSYAPYTEIYNDELAGIVYDLYKDDIEAFGYNFGV